MTTADQLLAESRTLRALARSLRANPAEDEGVAQDAYVAALRLGVGGRQSGP